MERALKLFDDEYQQKYVQSQEKENEQREEIANIVHKEAETLKQLWQEQLIQNEEMLIRLGIRNNGRGPQIVGDKETDKIQSMRDRSQTEYINTVVRTAQQ